MHLQELAKEVSIVLVYHAVYDQIPCGFSRGLHNVTSAVLYRHLDVLSQYFQFVHLDDLVEKKDATGLASVTFDDGYASVFRNALPILKKMNLPATIFINGATLSGQQLWRDSLRWLMNCPDIDLDNLHLRYKGKNDFYRDSKHPDNNSIEVAKIIEYLFQSHPELSGNCIDYGWQRDCFFLPHRLLKYGNHSHHHYVLSSLTSEQQFDEIQETQSILTSQQEIAVSNTFAVPFGEGKDLNTATLEHLQTLGYRALALSRNRFNCPGNSHYKRLHTVERIMPRGLHIEKVLSNVWEKTMVG